MSVRHSHSAPAWMVLFLAGLILPPLRAADPRGIRPVELVGSEAAVICELSQPKANWDSFRQSELFRRFVRSGFHDELLNTPGFRHWQQIEAAVTAAVGQSLSSQLLDLFSREVVLAAYLSPQNQPQGVLIAQAENSAAVERFLQTWKALEPNVAAQPLKFQGQTYYLRPASAGRKANLFYVTFNNVFAVSDHESRIQQVIELQRSVTGGSRSRPEVITQHSAYLRAASETTESKSPIRLLLLARAWDGVWQDASEKDAGAQLLRRCWPAIEAITVDVRASDGLHVELRGLINEHQTGERWHAWSKPTPDPRAFLEHLPADAVLVAAGGIHLQPLWQTLAELASERDRAAWKKGRRILQGILGGRDLLDDVLPALTHQFGLYVVPLTEGNDVFPFDGVLTVQLPQTERSSDLYLSLDQALSSALTLLAVQSAEKFSDDEPATVHVDLSGNTIARWLQTQRPFRVAYEATPKMIRLSRTKERLQERPRSAGNPEKSEFISFAKRWPSAPDLYVGLNLRLLREKFPAGAASSFLARPRATEDSATKPNPLAALELGDMVYLTAQFEPSRFSLRLGVVVESLRQAD